LSSKKEVESSYRSAKEEKKGKRSDAAFELEKRWRRKEGGMLNSKSLAAALRIKRGVSGKVGARTCRGQFPQRWRVGGKEKLGIGRSR